jgi:ABC-type lipoprotein release transport system permease subunit
VGTAAGLLLTKRSASWLSSFLTGVNDLYDAPLFAALALGLALAVFLAALVPALRVIHADPIDALRND